MTNQETNGPSADHQPQMKSGFYFLKKHGLRSSATIKESKLELLMKLCILSSVAQSRTSNTRRLRIKTDFGKQFFSQISKTSQCALLFLLKPDQVPLELKMLDLLMDMHTRLLARKSSKKKAVTLLGYASLEIHGAKRNGQEPGLTVHLFGTILQSSKFHSIQ